MTEPPEFFGSYYTDATRYRKHPLPPRRLGAAYEAYKGKFWLDDMGDAAGVMDEVDKTLLR